MGDGPAISQGARELMGANEIASFGFLVFNRFFQLRTGCSE